MDELNKLIEMMCANNETGLVCVTNEWKYVWNKLHIPKKYKTKYNLFIWDLSEKPIKIHLETEESHKDKVIIIDSKFGTIWKD